ncbi:MAG: hypothetical protein LBG75_03730 [Candidatus Nomurabacteria bacterium]|jgi:hypothetical protein|nr:hypothetical protein [Candidatus Nomurabacteria bacterium]
MQVRLYDVARWDNQMLLELGEIVEDWVDRAATHQVISSELLGKLENLIRRLNTRFNVNIHADRSSMFDEIDDCISRIL